MLHIKSCEFFIQKQATQNPIKTDEDVTIYKIIFFVNKELKMTCIALFGTNKQLNPITVHSKLM